MKEPDSAARDASEVQPDALLRIVEIANRSLDLRAVLETSLREILSAFACDVAMVLVPDERRATLQVAHRVGMPETSHRRPLSFSIDGTVYGQVFTSGEPRTVSDVAREVKGPVEGAIPLRSIALVPLLRGERAVGVLSAGASRPGAFDGDVLGRLRRLAGPVGLAVSNALLHSAVSRRTSQLVALNRLAAAAAGTLSRDGVLTAALAHLEEVTGLGMPAIYAIEPGAPRLVRISARGLSAPVAEATRFLPLDSGEHSLVQSMQRRRPLVWWLDAGVPSAMPALAALSAEGVRTMVMIPMSARGRLTGAITAASHRDRGLDDGDDAVLMAAGHQVGTALHNAELYEELRQNAERLESTVRERTEELRTQNERLRTVTAWLSHDLKRPLRSIHAISEMLAVDARDHLPPPQAELLRRVTDAADTMTERLHGLLDFVNIGAGPLHVEPVDMDRLLDECLADLRAEITNRGATIARTERWPVARVDARLARRLVTSLLENALRYGRPAEAPAIRLGVREGERPVCTVADNGPGVEADVRERLFQRLPRGGEPTGRAAALLTAREIAEVHGGRLWYEPGEPHGSVFLFTLPWMSPSRE